MLTLDRLFTGGVPDPTALPVVFLSWQRRTRVRQRVVLDDGREAGLFLPRGTVLGDGDVLAGPGDTLVRVRAAVERVSVCFCDEPLLFARACYHLGNRHVPLQIDDGRLTYAHDHVLDDMLVGLGLTVGLEDAPFTPEPGAYGGSAEQGQHGHAHAHHTHAH